MSKVVLYPSKTLRIKSETVVFDGSSGLTDLYRNMLDTMTKLNGAGLSAIQIGVPKQAIMLSGVITESGQPLFLLNPKIIGTTGDTVLLNEGCLSVPGVNAKMNRHTTVLVSYQNEQGENLEIKLTKMAAQAIEHELEHTKGQIFIDHFPEEERVKIRDYMDIYWKNNFKSARKLYSKD
jgi:peptide deformylase